MTVVAGQRQTADLASFQRAIDLSKEIVLLEPDSAPLTVLTKRWEGAGNVKSCDDYEYSWVEDERDVRFDAVNKGAGYNSAATEIEVDTGEVFYGAALVRVPRTGEIMYVSSVATNTLTVKRGQAGTSAAALVDNDPLFVIGAVAEEGDRSFEARSKNPTKITNYTQIFRTSIEASGSSRSSANMTDPHDWARQHRKNIMEHRLDIEHAALFGSKGTTTGPNGGRLTTSAGALAFLTENNQDAGGTLTEAEWESWVRAICRYGNKKTAFVSPLVLSVINNFAVGRLQTIQADSDKTYGLAITNYVCAHGQITLVKHNLLEGAVWGGYAIAIDMGQAAPGYRYLGGKNAPGGPRDTKVLLNRQENDRDGQKDEILTECGFEYKQVKTAGVLTGVKG